MRTRRGGASDTGTPRRVADTRRREPENAAYLPPVRVGAYDRARPPYPNRQRKRTQNPHSVGSTPTGGTPARRPSERLRRGLHVDPGAEPPGPPRAVSVAVGCRVGCGLSPLPAAGAVSVAV